MAQDVLPADETKGSGPDTRPSDVAVDPAVKSVVAEAPPKRFGLDEVTKFAKIAGLTIGAFTAVAFFGVDCAQKRTQLRIAERQLDQSELEVAGKRSHRVEPEATLRVSRIGGADRYAVSFALAISNHSVVPFEVLKNDLNLYIGDTVATGREARVMPVRHPPDIDSAVSWSAPLASESYASRGSAGLPGGSTGPIRPGEFSAESYDYLVVAHRGQWIAIRADLLIDSESDDGGAKGAPRNVVVLRYCVVEEGAIWSCNQERSATDAGGGG